MTQAGTPVPARRVLLVEDAAELRVLTAGLLRQERLDVRDAETGEAALEIAREFTPEVVILDVELPGVDGFETCRRLRQFSNAHVLMLTRRAADLDKVVGLSVGADDYVVKPCAPAELVARVRAMLRRADVAPAAQETRRHGDLELDAAGHEVRLDGERIELTQTEFALLETLSAEPHVVFSRAQLLQRVWGPNWFGDDHVVDVHMSRLRRKLDPARTGRDIVRTVRGVGYRMAT